MSINMGTGNVYWIFFILNDFKLCNRTATAYRVFLWDSEIKLGNTLIKIFAKICDNSHGLTIE